MALPLIIAGAAIAAALTTVGADAEVPEGDTDFLDLLDKIERVLGDNADDEVKEEVREKVKELRQIISQTDGAPLGIRALKEAVKRAQRDAEDK